MCWVMPPASPETTLVLRMASSSEVLPWSTWPMMVTTGGRGCRLALVVARGLDDHVLDVGFRDAADPVAELLDDQRRGVGVDGLVLRRHDAVLHQRLHHGGDALGHAVGELLDGDRIGHLHVAHDLLPFAASGSAIRRFSRSCRRFIAASERWRPSSSVALAMVSLPERRRSSSPLRRPRFSSAAGLSAAFFGPTGRPASARAAWAWAAAGSTASARGRARRGSAPARGRAALAAPSASSAAAAAARCSATSRSRPARSAASFSARSRASSASRASAASRSFCAALGLLRLGGLDRLQAPLELGVAKVLLRAAPRAVAAGGGAGLRDQDALALVLDRDRLGPAVAEALAHVAGLGAAAAQPERLALAGRRPWYPSFRSSLSRGGLPPPTLAGPVRGVAGPSYP